MGNEQSAQQKVLAEWHNLGAGGSGKGGKSKGGKAGARDWRTAAKALTDVVPLWAPGSTAVR